MIKESFAKVWSEYETQDIGYIYEDTEENQVQLCVDVLNNTRKESTDNDHLSNSEDDISDSDEYD